MGVLRMKDKKMAPTSKTVEVKPSVLLAYKKKTGQVIFTYREVSAGPVSIPLQELNKNLVTEHISKMKMADMQDIDILEYKLEDSASIPSRVDPKTRKVVKGS
jgi:hypothetical protein